MNNISNLYLNLFCLEGKKWCYQIGFAAKIAIFGVVENKQLLWIQYLWLPSMIISHHGPWCLLKGRLCYFSFALALLKFYQRIGLAIYFQLVHWKFCAEFSFSAASLIRFLFYTVGIDLDNEHSGDAYIAFLVRWAKTMLECVMGLPCVKAASVNALKWQPSSFC